MTVTVKRKVGRKIMAYGSVRPFAFYDPICGLQLGFDVIVEQPPNKTVTVILNRESACELVQAWVKMERENDQLPIMVV